MLHSTLRFAGYTGLPLQLIEITHLKLGLCDQWFDQLEQFQTHEDHANEHNRVPKLHYLFHVDFYRHQLHQLHLL
ncbi:hypothetical protein D3C73_969770 [compost metagenome]